MTAKLSRTESDEELLAVSVTWSLAEPLRPPVSFASRPACVRFPLLLSSSATLRGDAPLRDLPWES